MSRRPRGRCGARAGRGGGRGGGVAPPPGPAPFDPASLFGVNDRGVILDYTDPTKLFQLSTGTTPVTLPGDPIGYAADLGPSLKPALQATAASRPVWAGAPRTVGAELTVNGQFDADTDWTKGTDWTIGSGVATKVAGVAASLSQAITLTPGKFYQIHFVVARTAGTVQVRFAGGTTVSGISRNLAGSFTDVLLAVSGNTTLEFSADATFAGTIDRVTVKEVLTFSNMGANFDAVDDLMQTANVDLSNSDKLTGVTSHRVGAISGPQVIVAQGNISTTNGCTDMQMSSGHVFRLRGDTGVTAAITAAAAEAPAGGPQQCVNTGLFDLAEATVSTELVARMRGTLVASTPTATPAGAGVLANGAITIGRGAQGTSRLHGLVHRVILINRTLTAGEIANAEAWCKSGSAYCAVLGDSTVARLSSASGHPAATKTSSMVGGIVCGAADVSMPGDRIADQKALWAAISDKTALQAVFVQIGLNDVKGRVGANLATTAQVIADLQDLVDTINATKPAGCKVYICGLVPCKVWLDTAPNPAAAYQAWLDVNAAIAGTHTTNITGVDARITSHVAAMADGSNNLASQFDYNNDGVHPGQAGRFVNGQAWRAQLEADGLA